MNSKIAIERINAATQKQDTNANANFTSWDKEDALNKGMNDWVRRQVHGMNQMREGQEESQMRVDDLEILLIRDKRLSVSSGDISVDTSTIPENYRYYNKLTPLVSKGSCAQTSIKSFFVENANVDDYLQDWTFSPSYDFEQTFHTMSGKKFTIYHNGDFTVKEAILSYYRSPQKISCEKKDLEKEWEWKDDVAEVIIDEAVKILTGNIEAQNQFAFANKKIEDNN